jgi:hypothetical protein
MLDRYDALVDLRGVPLSEKADLLRDRFHREKFFGLRNEALGQLAADTGAAGDAIVREALGDTDVAVRKGALELIDPHSTRVAAVMPALTALLHDSSYAIIETVLEKLAEAAPKHLREYLAATRGVEGVLGRNVRVRWLELAYMESGKRSLAEELVALTGSSYEFRTRDNAMAALRRIDYFSVALAGNLVDAILNPNTRLSGPARDLLGYFYAQDKWHRMIGDFVRAGHWTGWQAGMLSGFAE